MKLRAVIAVALVALAAAGVACATSATDEPPSPDGGEAGMPPSGDAGTPPDAATKDAPSDAIPDAPTCSPAGWCPTSFPDPPFFVQDIWPFPNRAFAIGSGDAIGWKVLEWSGDTNQWTYIDDSSPNTGGDYPSLQSIFAPSQDEVFVTQRGLIIDPVAQTYAYRTTVFHGARGIAPATDWSWTHQWVTDCPSPDSPYVWGTSNTDVYLSACRTIYHLNGHAGDAGAADAGPSDAGDAGEAGGDAAADGGVSPWVPEYVDNDPLNADWLRAMMFFGITGTGPDDIWFLGIRGAFANCALLVHKTASGYQTVVDGTPAAGNSDPKHLCAPRAGLPMIIGGSPDGLAIAKDRLMAVWPGTLPNNSVVKITPSGDGGHAVAFARPQADVNLNSLWGTSEDDLWVLESPSGGTSGGGAILRGTKIWSDAGAYNFSTLAVNGKANSRNLVEIRGTSNTNLWAIGDNRAYHKTTP